MNDRTKELPMNDRMPYTTSTLCFLAGGIVGATAALLLAPQSGKDTRAAITRKVGDTATSAREIKDRVLQKSAEIWGDAAQRVSDASAALSAGDGYKGGKPERSTSI
jgi:hypothetical protein